MKRALSVVVVAICLATPAFSQLRMNGWGRAVWVPFFIDQNGDKRSTVQSSYGDEPDIEFMFSAASTNIGIDVGVIVQAQQFNQIGNAKIWWSPNNMFKLHVGLGRVTTLRGKVEGSTGAYSYARGRVTGATVPSGKDEPILLVNDGDGIFSRFNLTKMGAILEFTPIDGLFIGAALAPEFTLNAGLLAEDVYKGVHAAIGYEIPNIGHFRVGFIGGGSETDPAGKVGNAAQNWDFSYDRRKGVHAAIGYEIPNIGHFRVGFIGGGSETDPAGKVGNAAQNWDFSYDRRIEAAFALMAVPGLLVDIGAKYSLEKHPGILDQPGFSLENPLYVALGVKWTGINKFTLGFAADGHFLGTNDSKDDPHPNGTAHVTPAPQIAFNIYPSYDIGFCEIGADFTYGMQLGDEEGVNDKQMMGFGVYGQKQYGHGNIRMGVYANAPMNEGQNWGLSVPVWITYSF